jgi:hypothetical protein
MNRTEKVLRIYVELRSVLPDSFSASETLSAAYRLLELAEKPDPVAVEQTKQPKEPRYSRPVDVVLSAPSWNTARDERAIIEQTYADRENDHIAIEQKRKKLPQLEITWRVRPDMGWL